MSGTPSGNGFSPGDVVTVGDVQQELNLIEDLRNRVAGDDEYLEAILTNQRIRLLMMFQRQRGALPEAVDDRGTQRRLLPNGALGIANATIYENSDGPATFQVNGTVFVTNVRADETLGAGEPIKVVGERNLCERATSASLSLLGFQGGLSASDYERRETDGTVTIQPGETKQVLRVVVDDAQWIGSGTSDETYSQYQYFVDGDPLFETKLDSPLGLYNDTYRFSTPLSAEDSIEVQVTRDSDASASQDYFSKVDYIQ